jgi:hypothetical protein
MGQCNAQSVDRSSGVAALVGQSAAQLSSASSIKKKEPSGQGTPRGLELMQSCARFYTNGVGVANNRVGVANRAIQPSHSQTAAFNQCATRPTSSSRSTARTNNFAAACSFLWAVLSVALATIVWWAALTEAAGGPELTARGSSALPAQTVIAAIRPPEKIPGAAAPQTVSSAQSGILIRKVKTQRITSDGWGNSDRD